MESWYEVGKVNDRASGAFTLTASAQAVQSRQWTARAAHLAGISRQRCNESLAGMKGSGLAQLDYGAVRVLDLQALWRLAEPD